MRQFFIVRDQMCNVDITVILLNEYVSTDLVSNKSRWSTEVFVLIQWSICHTDR